VSRLFEFDGAILSKAIRNTFQRRKTNLPEGVPLAFTDEFRKDSQKQTQWKAFVKRAKPDIKVGNFDSIVEEIEEFLLPVLQAGDLLRKTWSKGGPWQ
jgi:hypothetical protein